MITINADGDDLVVRIGGWPRFFSMRRELRVPLAAVRSVAPAPEEYGRNPGRRAGSGSYWPMRPGPVYTAVMAPHGGGREYWLVVKPRPENLIAIGLDTTAGTRWRRIVTQVDDPAATSRAVRRAAGLDR